jgi:hypothetical protein
MDSTDYNENLLSFFSELKREKSIVENLEKSNDILERSEGELDQEEAVEEFRDLIL